MESVLNIFLDLTITGIEYVHFIIIIISAVNFLKLFIHNTNHANFSPINKFIILYLI